MVDDHVFFTDIEKEIHTHLLTSETDNGKPLDEVIDIDVLTMEIIDIIKSSIDKII